MRAILVHVGPHGFWLLLACVALVLLVLILVRALFPDFSSDDRRAATGPVLAESVTTGEAADVRAGKPRAEGAGRT